MSREERLNRLTRHQHGLVTRSQALSLGMSVKQLERRVDQGHWATLRPGVYALAGMPPTEDQALMAAVLAIGGRAAVSHGSAAKLWALKGVPEQQTIEMVTDLHRWARLDGVVGHRSGALFDEDLVTVRGVPVTSRARTLVDMSGSLSLSQLGPALDDALRRGLRLDVLRRCAGRLSPAPGRRMKLVPHPPGRTTTGLRPRRRRPRDPRPASSGRRRSSRPQPAVPGHGRSA